MGAFGEKGCVRGSWAPACSAPSSPSRLLRSRPRSPHAGQYGQYQALTSPTAAACLQAGGRSGAAPAWGPGAMVRWLSPRAGPAWCFGAPGPGRFDGQYLIDWGARWAPVMRSRWGLASEACEGGQRVPAEASHGGAASCRG